jgi:hypothetical protein
MALALYDRVQETTATTGTGTITLAGAVSGYQSFAVVGNGNTTYYCITSGAAWEVGIGTYSTTGPTLARTTVLSNSAGNTSPISLTGTSTVFITYPSERSVNLDQSTNTAYAPQLAASNGIVVNNQTVNASYSIPSGYSASSAGPITVAGGVTVTVPTGSRWVVL